MSSMVQGSRFKVQEFHDELQYQTHGGAESRDPLV